MPWWGCFFDKRPWYVKKLSASATMVCKTIDSNEMEDFSHMCKSVTKTWNNGKSGSKSQWWMPFAIWSKFTVKKMLVGIKDFFDLIFYFSNIEIQWESKLTNCKNMFFVLFFILSIFGWWHHCGWAFGVSEKKMDKRKYIARLYYASIDRMSSEQHHKLTVGIDSCL